MKILEHLRDPRAAWPALIILVIVVSLAVIALPIGTAPPPAFYTAASQIMPLLLIALAVEGRARDLFDAFADVFRIQLITVLCVGETVAIMAASGIVSNSTTYAQVGYPLRSPDLRRGLIMRRLAL